MSEHTHCFCITVNPYSMINIDITVPHKKCCMCGQMRVATTIGDTTLTPIQEMEGE